MPSRTIVGCGLGVVFQQPARVRLPGLAACGSEKVFVTMLLAPSMTEIVPGTLLAAYTRLAVELTARPKGLLPTETVVRIVLLVPSITATSFALVFAT